MLKLSAVFGMIALIVATVITPEPIKYNVVQIAWVTQSETTWINIYDVGGTHGIAQAATGGITNTVIISATEGMTFVIQEYKLVDSHLELVKFFSTAPVPASDFPTPTQTPQPTNTPVPTATIEPIVKHRIYTPIVMH